MVAAGTLSVTHKVSFSGGARSWIWKSKAEDGWCIVLCRGSTASSSLPLTQKSLRCFNADAAQKLGRYCGSAENPISRAGTTEVVIGLEDRIPDC